MQSSPQPVRPPERFLVFGKPRIEQPEIDELVASLKSGWIGTGPKVGRFEREFADYLGLPHAVAVSSATAALHLSILAAGIGPGDEVITTPMTFCASVNAILHAGATPVLADVDRKTMNLSPVAVERALTPRTRAILPVHFAGRMCDMTALCELAEKHDLEIIEDCAHAIESLAGDRHAGSFGRFGCFSFYATKNITTAEGGMVVTRDEEAAARIKILALHGMSKDAWKRYGDEGYKHYSVVDLGFKNNMTDLQASLGLHQLPRVEAWWKRREQIWKRYDQAFADLPVETPAPPEPGTRHAYHLYTLLIDPRRASVSRDEFLTRMTKNGIGVGVHYLSIPEHPYYQDRFGWRPEAYPCAAEIGRRTVSIPLSPALTELDVDDVIRGVRICLGV